jgi:hypothetical protein
MKTHMKSAVQERNGLEKGSEISWEQYLNEVMKNLYTGAWVKEVAKGLLCEMK